MVVSISKSAWRRQISPKKRRRKLPWRRLSYIALGLLVLLGIYRNASSVDTVSEASIDALQSIGDDIFFCLTTLVGK